MGRRTSGRNAKARVRYSPPSKPSTLLSASALKTQDQRAKAALRQRKHRASLEEKDRENEQKKQLKMEAKRQRALKINRNLLARLPLPRTEAEIEALVGPMHSLGPIEVCTHCSARFWPEEKTMEKFNLCCMGGRVHGSMPPLLDHPVELEALLDGTTSESKQFLDNARVYNNRMAFASTACRFKEAYDSPGAARGPMPVVLQGALYHKISALLPPNDKVPAFAQVYIYDTDNELKNRLKFNLSKGSKKKIDKLDFALTEKLQNLMHKYNPFVPMFKSALERLRAADAKGDSEALKLVTTLTI